MQAKGVSAFQRLIQLLLAFDHLGILLLLHGMNVSNQLNHLGILLLLHGMNVSNQLDHLGILLLLHGMNVSNQEY